MANQVYIIYEKTSPFSGWIRFYGVVDMSRSPDGSTKAEHLTRLATKYPDTATYFFPLDTSIDPEVQKFDQATSTLVDLFDENGVLIDSVDITPKAQAVLDAAEKEQDIIDNLPSWSQVEANINNIGSMDDAKAFILKLARVVYWDVKNRPD
ncbi:hypothetical protein LCGC14_2913870 [marine sediment metagenome]|uniref:Uncharacterized protein n=1 Tax=marine sediment metagenome TaxID=412755 RepID=A0A0F8XQW5_9ZZZZ|nr:hypothetical protein [Pricia sp.]